MAWCPSYCGVANDPCFVRTRHIQSAGTAAYSDAVKELSWDVSQDRLSCKKQLFQISHGDHYNLKTGIQSLSQVSSVLIDSIVLL